jgi:hypothetical protein
MMGNFSTRFPERLTKRARLEKDRECARINKLRQCLDTGREIFAGNLEDGLRRQPGKLFQVTYADLHAGQ